MKNIQVGNKTIGLDSEPFIIAEMSGNHNQSLGRALEIVKAAADSGAHAIKIQTYTADTMTLDLHTPDFVISDDKSLWNGETLYNLYDRAHTPWEWHEKIFKYANELGLICFSAAFDDTAVDFLMELNAPIFKIASFENTHLPLIKKVCSTGKPVIVSTGMATKEILDDIVTTAKEAGCKELILLKCTSAYPALPKDSHLKTIPYLRDTYDVQVGLSDHTLGITAAIASIALGATVIEKHFTLSRAEGGVDSAFSLEPHEMKNLVEETKCAWEALGEVKLETTENEQGSLVFRRSIYITKDIKKGEKLTPDNIRVIRPGHGMAPKYWDEVLGKTIKTDAKKGSRFTSDMIV